MGDAALIKKLGIKPGQRAAVVNPPDGYADRIGLPQGVEVTTDLDGTFDFVQLFAKDRVTLDRHLTAAHAALKPGGLFWISYPKGSSKVPTDLNRDVFWERSSTSASVPSPRSQLTRYGRRFGSARSPRWVRARPAARRRAQATTTGVPLAEPCRHGGWRSGGHSVGHSARGDSAPQDGISWTLPLT
jgi:hypothetical protein